MNMNAALEWRMNDARHRFHKLRWQILSALDASAKEPVRAVSVIVVGRNDNYGGDFSSRLRATLDWNLARLPNPELIYVEWNRIPDRASDTEWIVNRYPSARCFIVPQAVHQQISINPNIPVLEYFGKNIGIRHAQHSWILLINADCFIGYDVARNITFLNKDTVYATHYVSIRWDKHPLQDYHIRDKRLISVSFAANKNIASVVGNFLLTHKKNWMNATGYDERLAAVRAGVDNNGLQQLLHAGLRPMILGHHFHLDHPESIILGGSNPTHGSSDLMKNNIPYQNFENWGLSDRKLISIGERIWEIQTT